MLVSSEWLKEHINDENLVLIDTRPKTMYLYGHLPNSQSLSIEQVIQFDNFGSNLVTESENISKVFGSLGIDSSKTVIVCGDYMDPSAARIAWTLEYFGHENTKLLDAGINDLQRKGFEFTRKPYEAISTDFVPKINPSIRITADELKDNLEKFVILDARSPQEFMGGHLPNSKLIPFTDGISHDGRMFQEKQNLEKIFESQIPKNSEIVCYCMHGHRASSLFYQLRIAGYDKVRLYDGSFVEWYGRRFPLE